MTITEKILADHAGQREVHPADRIEQGDGLELDPASGEIRNLSKNETYHATPLPDFARETMAAGGLMKYVAKKKGLRPR